MPKLNEAFWKWFGDSKVVDSHGQPLVVYHGTNADFDAFKVGAMGYNLSNEVWRAGIFVTPDKMTAKAFANQGGRQGGRVLSLYAAIQNPIDLRHGLKKADLAYIENSGIYTSELLYRMKSSSEHMWSIFDSHHSGFDNVQKLKKLGYDGAIIHEGSWSGEMSGPFTAKRGKLIPVWVVFDAAQLKSATDNDGTWDADDPDIRSNPFEQPEPSDSNYDPEALAAGIEVEFEHTVDPAIAKRIAKDHLDEDPDYYTKLKTLGLNPGDRSMSDHDREILENPGWVDKIVKQHCAELSAYAQAHGLPMPLLNKCKPSKEFGCGHYGCVMATSDPGIVFKITSDESEAHFIACYMKLRDKLPFDDLKYSGIVDYKAIVGLKESSRSSRRVYAIWREEAQNVGKWENGWKAFLEYKTAEPNERHYFERQAAATNALMRTFQGSASQFRLKLKSVKDRAEYFNKVQEAIELSETIEVHGTRGELQFTPPSWIKGTRRLAFHLRTCQIAAELLESEYLGDLLGKTLGFFLKQGLLLADVHQGNLGTRGIDKEAIITDPGHLVILKPEWEQVNIEAI